MNNCPTENQEATKSPHESTRTDDGLLYKVKRVVVRTLRLLGILEALLALLFGGFIGALITNRDNGWILFLVIILAAIYIPLLVVKVCAQWEMPASLFDHLSATQKLKQVERELARKASIDVFVDDAIKSLNAGTCSIGSAKGESDQCLEPLQSGLEKVLTSVIHRPQQVLDCDMARFSVGVYVEVLSSEQKDAIPVERECINEFIVFRDDFRIQEEIDGSPFDASGYEPLKGGALEMRHAIEKAMNEARMDFRQISFSGKRCQLITGPIPLVCDDNSANGAIWICRECAQNPPLDTENILLIFGRIVANWLYKYNECVSARTSQSLERVRVSNGKIPYPFPNKAHMKGFKIE